MQKQKSFTDDKKPLVFESFDEREDSPTPVEKGEIRTETIDINKIPAKDTTAPGDGDLQELDATSVHRLLQALPIPALLIDMSGYVVFANRSWRRISPEYKRMPGCHFSSLFPDAAVARKAQSLLEKVLSTKKTHVAEGELRVEKSRLWGRMHLRSLRIGRFLSVLLLVEHLAPDRQQLVLIKKFKDRLVRTLDEFEMLEEERFPKASTDNEHFASGIAQQKRMEEALGPSAQMLRNVLSASPMGIGYFEEGRLRWANPAMMEMFALGPQDDWLDKSPSEFYVSSKEYERVQELFYRDVGSGQPVEAEAEFKRRDGSTFDGRITVSAADPLAPRRGTIVMVSDVSARKRMEQELVEARRELEQHEKEPAETMSKTALISVPHVARGTRSDLGSHSSEEAFRAVFQESLNATLIINAETGTILQANKAVGQILKYEVDQIVGRHFSMLEPPDQELLNNDPLQSLAGQGIVLEGRHLLTSDGKLLPGDLAATSIPWDGGTAVVITFREVKTGKTTHGATVPGEPRFRALLENCPVGIVACDLEGNVTEVNTEASRLLGASSLEAASGLNLLFFPPLVEAGVSSLIGECLKSGKPVVSEFPNKVGANRQIYSRVHAVPIRNADGEILGAQAVLEDISAQKRSEALLLQSERLKAVGEMAGAVAHNFNDLLQSVAAGARQALGFCESRNFRKMRPLLDQIFDGTRQAVTTLRYLQLFSRARRAMGVSRFSSGQMEVFDLTEAVREALERTRLGTGINRRKGAVEIAVDLEATEGCFIEGEESEIIEVVVNLLKNAEEALPLGGRIKIKTLVKKDDVILQVQDNGVGIPEKFMGRIFEPFWTTKDSHLGMGLTNNFGIVRRHKGTITVTSRKRMGTTFTLKLPQVKKVSKVETQAQQASEHSFRVLLIDDDEPIVRLYEKGFRSLGHTPIPATSGQEALKILEDTEVDAVVCDLAMSGMNGWEVARAIHEICLERGIPKPPFIMVTGWAGQLSEDEILAHPDVDRIVEKPIKVPRLLQIVTKEIKVSLRDTAFFGTVDGIDFLEYMQLVMLSGKSVVVEVLQKNGVRGLIFVDKGRVLHATCGDLEGEEALYCCLSFSGGSFSNLPWREPEYATIDKPGEFVLIESVRRRDEMKTNSKDTPD